MTAKTYKGKVFKRRMQSLMLCTKATDAQNETAQRLKAYSQDQQEEDGTIRVRFYGEYCRDGMQPVYSYRLDGKNRHCQSCSGEVGQRGRFHRKNERTQPSSAVQEGGQSNCNTYRGISLLSHVGKVPLKIITIRRGVHCEAYNIFPEEQFWFSAGSDPVDPQSCWWSCADFRN
ncbi:unnamed protein product [Pylaiella littoralis]